MINGAEVKTRRLHTTREDEPLLYILMFPYRVHTLHLHALTLCTAAESLFASERLKHIQRRAQKCAKLKAMEQLLIQHNRPKYHRIHRCPFGARQGAKVKSPRARNTAPQTSLNARFSTAPWSSRHFSFFYTWRCYPLPLVTTGSGATRKSPIDPALQNTAQEQKNTTKKD